MAVEGDWPDCFRINQWVKGRAHQERSAREVLETFARWPTWMWANTEVADFIGWLRHHNLEQATQVGFYGLDVYSLWESMQVVLDQVDEHDPEALAAAHRAWECFKPDGKDPQAYAYASRLVPAPVGCPGRRLTALSALRGRACGGPS